MDEDRDSILQASKMRKNGDICEKEDDRDEPCKEQCDEMYKRKKDREDCEELTVNQITALFELYEILEEPDVDDLQEVEVEDFDVFLNVSMAVMEDLIDDWNSREAKDFLYWVVSNEEVAVVFEKEDYDYNALTDLLKKISRFRYSEIYTPFITKIEGGRLMEVAIDSRSEKVIEWFMEYIEDKNSSCQDETVSRDCFSIYCRIGKKIDTDSMENWLDYKEFESYIEDIVEKKINANNSDDSNYSNRGDGNGWQYGRGEGQFEEIGDITDDWVKDLCGGLTNYY